MAPTLSKVGVNITLRIQDMLHESRLIQCPGNEVDTLVFKLSLTLKFNFFYF